MKKRLVAALVAITLVTTNAGFVYAAETVESKEDIIQISEETKTENGDEKETLGADIEEIDNSGAIDTQKESSTEDVKDIKSEQNKGYTTQSIEEDSSGDYNYSVTDGKAIIIGYSGNDSVLIIPETLGGVPVTEIGASAFNGIDEITEVMIPNSVVEIKREAFSNCTGIEKVTLSNRLTYIGTAAFYGCEHLTSIEIPASLDSTTAEYDFTGVFEGSGLEKVTFEEGTEQIAESLFKNCTKIESIEIPETVVVIEKEAFSGCTGLKEISVPDTVTKIGLGAFQKCTSLSYVKLSKGLTYIGTAAFYGCEHLTSIEIPASLDSTTAEYDFTGVFEGSGLEKVTFEEGTEQIAESLFKNCTKIESIEIPESVVAIEKEAFSGCTGLKEISVPDTVTKIGLGAFQKCTSLSYVKLSKGLTYIGTAAFYGCEHLTSIEIPASLDSTTAEYDFTGVFEGSGLEKVTFEEGTEQIAESLFKNCTKIESIEIPETVVEIEGKAFSGCTGLKEIRVPDSVTKIADNAFDQTDNVIVNCYAESFALEYALSHDLLINVLDWDSYSPLVLNRSESYYTTNYENQSSYIDMVVHYVLDGKHTEEISEKEVVISLPSNFQLIENSVKKDNKISDTYTIENDNLIVPVDEEQGTIRFSVNIEKNTKSVSAAWLSYTYNGKKSKDIIDIYTLERDYLTLISNEITNTETIFLEGIAPAESLVTITLDETKKAEFKATKSGYYSGEIELDDPQNGQKYTVIASIDTADGTISRSTSVKYDLSNPIIEEFKLYYYDHLNKNIYDLLNREALSKTIVFYPLVGYTFKIKVTYPERIKNLYVTSTRGGITKKIKAEYDSDTGYFITSDKFEKGNNSYVPGNLSVEYELDYDAVYDSEEKRAEEVIKSFDNADIVAEDLIKDVKTTNSGLECTVQVQENIQLAYIYKEYPQDEISQYVEEITQDISVNNLTRATRTAFDGTELLEDLFKSFVINDIKTYVGYQNGNYCIVQYNEMKKVFSTWTVKSLAEDMSKERLEDYVFMLYGDIPEKLMEDSANAVFGFAWDSGEALLNYMGTLYELEMQINPEMTALQKAQVQTSREIAFAVLLARVVNASLPLIGVTGGIPGMVICGIGHYLIGEMLDTCEDIIKNQEPDSVVILVVGKFLSWIIDPSGYVYEAVTDNRLSGVTVTAYWKSDENAEAIQWNALEYQQMNPLITDSLGAYAWNVPEGYWQVKYEKEGYETAYSDWMPVPPPQTDVNIGLVSKEKPLIESFTVYADHADVVFSKYMIPDTVSSLKLSDQNGNNISYELEYDTTSVNSEGVNYAKEYTLRFTGNSVLTPESTCRLTADGSAKSYVDIAMDAGETEAVVNKNMEIIAPDKAVVKMGEPLEIPVTVANASEELAFTAVSEFEEIASVTEIGENSIKVTGNMYGEADITISVPGTDLVKIIRVTVGKTTEEAEVTPTVVLPQSVYTMKAGDELTVTPEVYPETAEGNWSIISGEDVIAVKGNTFTAKESGEAVLRYTLAEYEEVFAECRIIVEAVGDVVRGDVDGNKTVDIADLRMVLRSVCGKVELTEQQKKAADVTDDSRVDIQDLRKILRYVCRKIDEL